MITPRSVPPSDPKSPFRLVNRGVGEIRELTGDGQDIGSGVVRAALRLRRDPMGVLAGLGGEVIEAGSQCDPGVVEAAHDDRDAGDAFGEQTRVGRVL